MVGHINSGDTAFVLICAALVALMTPALAFFYGGLVRRKNFLAIMMQSFISMGIVTTIWVLFGYSLAFSGGAGGVIGNFHWALLDHVGHLPGPWAPNIPAQAHFVYQEMFAIITPALITGAFADRVKFKSYLWFLVLWSIIVYIPFVHLIWGGGWLAEHGVRDFAGGAVVHISAGYAALASVFVVGKRKFGPGERSLPHNVAFVALGTGLLWFGWFGFNAGSALAANGIAAQAFVNTDIAGSIAMCTWLALTWWHDGKPSLVGALTGAVAGLATSPPAPDLCPRGLRSSSASAPVRSATSPASSRARCTGTTPSTSGPPTASAAPWASSCSASSPPTRSTRPAARASSPATGTSSPGRSSPPSRWPPTPSWLRSSSSS